MSGLKTIETLHFSVWIIEGENKGAVELERYLKTQGIGWSDVETYTYIEGTWIVRIKGTRHHPNCVNGG